jgi:molybdate transport system substrate-binding protein
MKMHGARNIFLALTLVVLLTGCSSPVAAPAAPVGPALPAGAVAAAPTALAQNITLKVFAPSSLLDAAKEITAAYEAAHPGVKLAFEIGHTPTQRLQLTQGAMGDVFVTASQKDMDDAVADQSVAAGKARVFATNQLVVVLTAQNSANLQKLEHLANQGVRVLVAVVDTPIGKATLDSLGKMDQQIGAGFKGKVLANVVSNESGVKPIVAKLKLNEADAGIVYVTDAVAAPDLKTLSIPPEFNMILQLNAAPLAKAANPEQAAAFAAYLVSSDGQAILRKWGFLPGKP